MITQVRLGSSASAQLWTGAWSTFFEVPLVGPDKDSHGHHFVNNSRPVHSHNIHTPGRLAGGLRPVPSDTSGCGEGASWYPIACKRLGLWLRSWAWFCSLLLRSKTLCDIHCNAAHVRDRPGPAMGLETDCQFSYLDQRGPRPAHVLGPGIFFPGRCRSSLMPIPRPCDILTISRPQTGQSRTPGALLKSWPFDDTTPPSSLPRSVAHRSRTSESARPV